MTSITLWTVGLILFCVVAEAGSQLNFKAAADAVSPERPITSLLSQRLLWLGILLWAVESVVWLLVLEQAPLSIAFPIMSLTYAATPIAAALVLEERLTRRQAIGAALVTLGAVLVSISDLKVNV